MLDCKAYINWKIVKSLWFSPSRLVLKLLSEFVNFCNFYIQGKIEVEFCKELFVKLSFRLPDYCNVFQAAVTAIKMLLSGW